MSNQNCVRQRCIDPCPGSCGIGAQCSVINHLPICTCPSGFTGDPFTSCSANSTILFLSNLKQGISTLKKIFILFFVSFSAVAEAPKDACSSTPCGANAVCRNGQCFCLPDYQGDPYFQCRPECVQNTDCPQNRACIKNKCVDPCPGVCGQNAECSTFNHIPICSCPSGMTGNAFSTCNRVQRMLTI